MGRFLVLLMVWVMSCNLQGIAQIYDSVTHVNGPKIVNGRVVTVYPGPLTRNEYSVCNGIGPFRVGLNNPDPPGFYKFKFDRHAANVKMEITSLNDSETVTIRVNGNHYPITPDRFSYIYTSCTNNVHAILKDGNVVGPPGAYDDSAAGGAVHVTGDIAEMEVYVSNIGYGVHFSVLVEGTGISVCEFDSVMLPAANYPNASYRWTGPDNFSSDAHRPVIPVADQAKKGLYVLTVTDDTGSFVNTVYLDVIPVPYNAIRKPDLVCLGTPLQLPDTLSDTAGVTYLWRGPNGFTSSRMPLYIDQAELYHAGVYTLTTTKNGCSHVAEAFIEVTRPVTYRMTRTSCRNDPFMLNGKPLTETGVFHDTLTGSNGCDSFVTVNHISFPVPEVSVSLLTTTKLCMSDPITLEAKGTGNTYTWLDQEGTVLGSGERVSFIYTGGQYPVIRAETVNDYNCVHSDTLPVLLVPCCKVYVPNAFTPNGDGINDGFRVVVHGQPAEYLIKIFSRFGELVYTGIDPGASWDGMYKGRPADVGVYFFEYRSVCMDGTSSYEKGDLTLIR